MYLLILECKREGVFRFIFLLNIYHKSMNTKTLVYTTFYVKNPSYESLIWEWLISLRTLGNHKGEVIIFDYGMPQELIDKLNNFELGAPTIIKLPESENGLISNRRNIDVIPHLEKYKDYMFAHFDADIWFQRDISPLWEDCSNTQGVVVGKEVGRMCRYRGPANEEEHFQKQQDIFKGFIFGGFIAGKYEPYLNKLKYMKNLFETTWKPTIEWGTDQAMITHITDPKVDYVEGIIYGASVYFCEVEDKIICKCNDHDYIHQGKEVIGIHVLAFNSVGFEKEDQYLKYRFKTRYPELWQKHQ